jgi:hypothetical protein
MWPWRRPGMGGACGAPRWQGSGTLKPSGCFTGRAKSSRLCTGKIDFWVPPPTTSETPQHRRLHLLRIPNHYFDYSVSPPLQTYFAQDDPVQSCPGHCPPTLHRITMNLCNVALRLLRHIVPTCVVRGVRGWGRVRETRTKPDRRERASRGVARRGAIPGKPGREPPGAGDRPSSASPVAERRGSTLTHGRAGARKCCSWNFMSYLWEKYSYLARTMGNFAQDRRQGVQSCTACFFHCAMCM